MRDDVLGLLGSTLRRAQTTISDKTKLRQEDVSSSSAKEEDSSIQESSVGGLLQSAISRAQSTIEEKNPPNQDDDIISSEQPKATTTSTNNRLSSEAQPVVAFPKTKPYHGNPAITNTALAQSLWSSILRPNIDSAIDATCGNGHDSVALARMLFSDNPQQDCHSQLVCVDIQQQACSNTTAALQALEIFDANNNFLLENDHIQVLHTSHAPLPRPNDSSSVGLVVYNLGYLPNSDKDCVTQMDSTLYSIADALLTVRIGGMVSVVTYPMSNPGEDLAVRTFLECVALLSSTVQSWNEFLEVRLGLADETIREGISASMERIVQQGDPKQTWRVTEHKKLGMDRAPILITATRIK
jgi:hypothetical protein